MRARGGLTVLLGAALGAAAVIAAVLARPASAGSYTLVELSADARAPAVRLLETHHAALVAPELRLYRLRSADAARVLPRLRALGVVRRAGPDREVGTLAVAQSPTEEPLYPTEWWRGAIGIDGLQPPGPGKAVTVVDSGIDLTHPEFAGRPDLLMLNPQEPAPTGGRHGTGVASLVGAPINGVGISGIYPQAALRSWDAALGEGVQLTTSDIVAGILAAARQGPGVINLSLGGPGADPLIRQAVAAAVASGSLVVAASGNDGPNGRLTYPASYPHVLTVGSLGRAGEVSPFSSQSRFVDLVAPGEDIETAWPVNPVESPDGYRSGDGTSFAAPLVSGAAAWIWTARPDLDASQLFEVLRRSARDIGPPGKDVASGFGVLNVGAALAAPTPVRDPLEPNETPEELRPGGLARGIAPVRALTTRSQRTAGLVARLAASEDPRDIYKIWIPRGWTISVSATADTDVDLGLWRDDAASTSTLAAADRLARGARRGTDESLTYANTGAGAQFLLSVTMARGISDAQYTLRVARG
jgi:hypothetical protein